MTAHSPPGEAPPPSHAPAPLRLKKRADFVATAKGRRLNAPGFTLQTARRRLPVEAETARMGLTVTKKTGNSVERNRIRRRLREALRLAQSLPVDPAHDYVLVARREILSLDFAKISAEITSALRKIHAPRAMRGARTH